MILDRSGRVRRNQSRYAGWAKKLRSFWSTGRGSAAIEFAIIAPIFIGLLISILETGIYFFAQNVLQAAAVQASRPFLTGTGSNMTQSTFAANVCSAVKALFNCGNVMIDVQNYSAFSGANVATPTLTFDSHGNVTNNWTYSPGTAGQIVVVRLIYQWPIITGPFAFILPNLSNGTSEIMGVTAFRVEP